MGQDGAQIEQRLGGMLVHAVAGIEHRQARLGLQQPGRAGRVVAQDDGLRAQRAQRQAGIFQRLALFNARRQTRNQRRVGAQSLGGQLKAGARARGRLVKKQRDAALGQNAVARQRVLIFESRGAARAYGSSLQSQVLAESSEPGL